MAGRDLGASSHVRPFYGEARGVDAGRPQAVSSFGLASERLHGRWAVQVTSSGTV